MVKLALSAALLACAFPQQLSAESTIVPYLKLREAYAHYDPQAAAHVFAANATYRESNHGSAQVVSKGKLETQRGFAALFDILKKQKDLKLADLNFRITERKIERGIQKDKGIYRLRVGNPHVKVCKTYYGRFQSSIQDDKFVLYDSSPATRNEFENGSGDLLANPGDEWLDPEYYNQWLGTYMNNQGQRVLITRSIRFLFALDESSMNFRRLTRQSGTNWVAGETVIADTVTTTFEFEPAHDGVAATLAVENNGHRSIFSKIGDVYREPVEFMSGEIRLEGTILKPDQDQKRRPAVVMIHGSGAQDRHGYASIIELLALQFVRADFLVMTFDKRGVNGSGGDWNHAGFDELAGDVGSAMNYLRNRIDTRPDLIGVAGSSQAGWVAAKLVTREEKPDFVFLLGAAGAAMTVEEQNLYNTRIRMEIAGISSGDIEVALDQQRAFFAAKRDSCRLPNLVQLTAQARDRSKIQEWLFPDSIAKSESPEWYDVLEPGFDPLPSWTQYGGKVLFVFAENDDSTDSRLAISRLSSLPANESRQVRLLENTQHLGLIAESIPLAELDKVSKFNRALWDTIREWALSLNRKVID